MKITVCGCGFLGSHVSEELAKLAFSQELLDATFRFIDFDIWEERNAANQHVSLTEAKNGTPKAITCADYAKRYEFKAEAVMEKLTAENAEELLEASDLVIECLDNIPTRQILWGRGIGNSPCPVMHTGLSRKGDGFVNWSASDFDTFPFKPQNLVGRTMQEQDIKEPPCEMYKYRSNGLVLIGAIAKAAAFYLGKDPWNILQGAEEKGIMTCWETNPTGAKLLAEDEYLVNDFFPIHQH